MIALLSKGAGNLHPSFPKSLQHIYRDSYPFSEKDIQGLLQDSD